VCVCMLPETNEECVITRLPAERSHSHSHTHTHTHTQRLCCNITPLPKSLLSCVLNHPLVFFVFPWSPVGPLSLYYTHTHTHTLFSTVQILSDFLPAALHFPAASPHCSPALLPPPPFSPWPAVSSLLQRGEPLSCSFHTEAVHSFICM